MPPQQRSGANDNEVTIQWLKDNYQVCTATDDTGALREGVPRASVYERYQRHYSQQRGGSDPLINSATFGKLLRTAFPNITTRRLGHRGQSKYYYCGITEINTTPQPPQETPEEMYLDTDNEQFSITTPQHVSDDNDASFPPFETPAHHYTDDSWQDLAVTQFTQMYHQHCKYLLHTVESHQNATEQITAFYKAMPRTILDLLQSDAAIGEELCNWDCMLYDAIILACYPTIDASVDTSSVPQRLTEWSSTLLATLPVALEGYPEELVEGKMAVSRIFNAKLERIVHLNILIQAADSVIQKNATRMLNIWQQLNLQQVSDRAQWITGVKESAIDEQFEHIGSLLKSTNIRHWIDWMDAMMDMHIARGQSYSHIKTAAVIWSTYTSLTRREMELLPHVDATILESFEKLWVFANDYILYLIEQETGKRNIDLVLSDDYPNSIYSNNRNRSPDDYISTTTTPNTMMSLV
ncbi:RFX DNA-binding domain-containing protein [Fennellomyces sp. T-0311]|nr:RFX DNA-binding domain-containing protein [Fennellomyces sp. T-0311]